MIANAAVNTLTILVVVWFSCVYAICPAQDNGTFVLPYRRISTTSPSDAMIKKTIRYILNKDMISFGMIPENPALTCKQIAELRPHYDSGSYWIKGMSIGEPVKVYCEIGINNEFGQSGGWMRIANVDMRTNDSFECPTGLVFNVTQGKRLCRRPSLAPGCSLTRFNVHGVKYRKVCGKVIGYQYYKPFGFGPSRSTPQIDQTYIDGVSITHSSPRQHVWTFANAVDEAITSGGRTDYVCPCLNPSVSFTGVIPNYVQNDYFCETGSRMEVQRRYYFDDPLWDSKGCGGESECCDRGGPWFCKQLPQTTQADIELRVCTNSGKSDEDIVLEQIKLYIQ